MVSFLAVIFVFCFGLIIGSFLNSVIYRSYKKESLRGRSYCPNCHHQLAWFDLIPVLSFIFLKGRCRYCHRRIAWQYPLVELATGLIFVIVFIFCCPDFTIFSRLSFPTLVDLIYLLLIGCLLIIVFVYDLKYFIIPSQIVNIGIISVFIYRFWKIESFSFSWRHFFWEPLLTTFLVTLFFGLIWFFSQGKWIGEGDIQLVFFLTFFLGFNKSLVALFFAFTIGAIIGLVLIALKKKEMKSEVPFGPFLVTGTFIALFWGGEIIQWYLRM